MNTRNRTKIVLTIAAVAIACLAFTGASAKAAMTVTGPDSRSYTVINNTLGGVGNSEYSESGFAGQDTGVGGQGAWLGDRRWGNVAGTTTATWSFTGLSSGPYDVYVSWRNGSQGNLGNADYTGTDGFANISVNQVPGTSSYAGSLGTVTLNDASNNVDFVHLGQVSVADTTFDLTVTDSPTGAYIFADGAAMAFIPEPSTFALAALGLLGLLACGRRRRR